MCEWVSPFGNSVVSKVVYRLLPPDLSQITTSFIASDCQGIHRVRLVTYHITRSDSLRDPSC